MLRYVVLATFTDAAARDPKRFASDEARRERQESYRRHGVTLVDAYLTLGPYDVVIIYDAPDDEAMGAVLLEAGRRGHLRTTTLRAFPRDEMRALLGSLT